MRNKSSLQSVESTVRKSADYSDVSDVNKSKI